MKLIAMKDARSVDVFRDRIIQGDCLEVMKAIPDQSIDMILCDLPYGTTQNKWDSIINFSWNTAELSKLMVPSF